MTILSFKDAKNYADEQRPTLDLEALKRDDLYLDSLSDYLVGTYPPLKALGTVDDDAIFEATSSDLNLYFHIPFCEQYCTFCHFAKEINPKPERVEAYLAAMHSEINLTAARLYSKNVKTMFFGGGTPSYLNPKQLEGLLDRVHANFSTDGAEATFELHPGLIRQRDYRDRIRTAAQGGINRWVSGVQSMDDKILAKLNRKHTSQEVLNMLDLIRAEGCDNLSLDLMYGLPYQNAENWYHSVKTLVDAGVTKFNMFPLLYKPTDPIMRDLAFHPEIFPSDEQRFEMYFMAEAIFRDAGFKTGPIFYWSKDDGSHSRQQELKFDSIEECNLVPFGISGFGYMSDIQFYNEPKIDNYCAEVSRGRKPVWKASKVPLEERMRREMMFGLRSSGINSMAFEKKYGLKPEAAFPKEIQLLKTHGLAFDTTDGTLQLTRNGTLVAGAIGLMFFSDEVKKLALEGDAKIQNHRRDPLEQHDFTPIGRILSRGQLEKLFGVSSGSDTSQGPIQIASLNAEMP